VGVELVAAEVREVLDVCRSRVLVGDHGVAHLQLLEVHAEGVLRVMFMRRPAGIAG
jgi:hypothetical protein